MIHHNPADVEQPIIPPYEWDVLEAIEEDLREGIFSALEKYDAQRLALFDFMSSVITDPDMTQEKIDECLNEGLKIKQLFRQVAVVLEFQTEPSEREHLATQLITLMLSDDQQRAASFNRAAGSEVMQPFSTPDTFNDVVSALIPASNLDVVDTIVEINEDLISQDIVFIRPYLLT